MALKVSEARGIADRSLRQVGHNPVEDVLEATHGRLLAARYLPRLQLLDGEELQRGVVFLEPPRGHHGDLPPPRHAARAPASGTLPAEELRLRWRADRGETVGPPSHCGSALGPGFVITGEHTISTLMTDGMD